MQFNDLGKQYQQYKEEIDAAIQNVLNSNHFIMGKEVYEIEEQLAEYIDQNHCISTSSGTDSLLMSLMAIGVGSGDEVITVPFTWIATAEVIKLLGAKPVFVDIDPKTYLMDLNHVEAAITEKTKAIIPVDLFGHLVDYDQLHQIASKNGITVIQDAAQSFGATQNSRKSCSQGHISCTSFFPAKSLGCYGDGGAIFTDNDSLASDLRAIRTHGGQQRHVHTHVGINGRLDTIQAAVLLVKLRYFDQELRRRQELAIRYTDALSSSFVTPVTLENNTHSYAVYTIRTEHREEIQGALKSQGVPTAVYYPKSLHEQPVFGDLGYTIGDFPHSEKASQQVLSLPIHPWLTEEEQTLVIDQLLEQCLTPARGEK
ncbi:MAG: DegT/DnrJ/EryC1/StrS family aminotransferase [Chlamydiota bacterium]